MNLPLYFIRFCGSAFIAQLWALKLIQLDLPNIASDKSQLNWLRFIVVACLGLMYGLFLMWPDGVFERASLSTQIAQGIFYSLLLITGLVDAKTRYIYDHVLIILAVATLVVLNIDGVGAYVSAPKTLFKPLLEGLLGAFVGFLSYALVYLGGRLWYREEAFGLGDVYLLSAVGLILGWKVTLVVAMGAFYFAALYILILFAYQKLLRKDNFDIKSKVAFGPFICFSAYLFSIYGEALLKWYFQGYLG